MDTGTGTITEDDVSKTFNVLGNDTLDMDAGAANTISVWKITLGTNSYGLTASDVQVTVTPDNHLTVTLLGTGWNSMWDGQSLGLNIYYRLTGDNGENSSNLLALSVRGLNDAPVLDASVDLSISVLEDATLPAQGAGTLVSELVDPAGYAGGLDNVTDDSFVYGIAITGANTSHGTWHYSVNNGASWTVLGAVSDSNALTLNSSARLAFVPDAGYSGTVADGLTIRAWDISSGANGSYWDTTTNGGTTGYSTATDTVSITVNAVNDAPVVSAIDAGTVSEDAAVQTIDLLAGQSDLDGNPLSAINITVTDNLGGAVAFTDNGNGTISIDPDQFGAALNSGHSRTVTVNYDVSDGTATTANTATLVVAGADDNTPPVITFGGGGTSASLTIDDSSTGVATVTATDIDGDTLTYSFSGGADQAVFTIDTSTGALSFLSTPDYANPSDAGADNIYDVQVQVDDGQGGIDTQDIAVKVSDRPEVLVGVDFAFFTVGDDPVMVPSSLTISSLAQIASATARIGMHDSGDELTIDAAVLVGTGISASYNAGSGLLSLTGIADAATYQTVLRQVTYFSSSADPTENDSHNTRPVYFQVENVDGLQSNEPFTYVAVNVPPELTGLDDVEFSSADATSAAQVIDADVTFTDLGTRGMANGSMTVSGFIQGEDVISIRNEGTGSGQIGVSGAQVTYEGTVIGTFTGGSGSTDLVISFNADVTDAGVDALIENLTFFNTSSGTPTESRTLTITVADHQGATGSETVDITLTDLNAAPVATAQALSTDEDTELTGMVTGTDADGDSLTFALVSNSAIGGTVTSFDVNTGAFTFSPDADFSGQASFQFTASDGIVTTAAATISIDVTAVNDAPTLAGVGPMTAFTETNANNGGIHLDPYVTVSDSDSADFNGGTLTISGLVSGEDTVYARNVGTGAGQIGISGNTVTYGGVAIATFTGGNNGNDLVVSFNANATPAAVETLIEKLNYSNSSDNPSPVHDLVYTLTDGDGGSTSASLRVLIQADNDAATITGDTSGSVTEDGTLTETGTLIVTDPDTGENQVVAQTNTAGTYGTFSITAAGVWTYNLDNANASVQALNSGQHLTETFTVASKDGTASETVTITINGADDAPNEAPTISVTSGLNYAYQPVVWAEHLETLTVGDVNGDGFDDIGFSVTPAYGGARVYLSDGAASPSFAYSGLGFSAHLGVQFVDFDGDGDLDILALRSTLSYIWVNNGGALTEFTQAYEYILPSATSVIALNANDVGYTELAVLDPYNGQLQIFTPDYDILGNGILLSAYSVSVRSADGSLIAGDFNEDGTDDLVVAGGGAATDSVLAVLNSTAATGINYSMTSLISASAGVYGLATGDFNGDGHLDFVAARGFGAGVEVYLGDGTGAFTAHTIGTFSGNPIFGEAIQAGDVDGDGDVDLLIVSEGRLLLNQGNDVNGVPVYTSFDLPQLAEMGDLSQVLARFADVNNDGLADIVIGSLDTSYIGVLLGSDGFSTNKGTPVTLSQASGNVISIGDADAGSNDVEISLSATHGTLTLSTLSGLTFSSGDGTGDASMTFRGTVAEINAALDGMTFTPEANYSGNAELSVNVNDTRQYRVRRRPDRQPGDPALCPWCRQPCSGPGRRHACGHGRRRPRQPRPHRPRLRSGCRRRRHDPYLHGQLPRLRGHCLDHRHQPDLRSGHRLPGSCRKRDPRRLFLGPRHRQVRRLRHRNGHRHRHRRQRRRHDLRRHHWLGHRGWHANGNRYPHRDRSGQRREPGRRADGYGRHLRYLLDHGSRCLDL